MASYMQQQQIFLFIFLEGGLNFTKADGLMNEKKTFQLCSTLHCITIMLISNVLHYIFYSTCSFFWVNSQHLQHSLEHSVVQKRNVQKMYLSSCLIKFIETKLNSQDTSNIKRISNCKNVFSLNKVAYQDRFLKFSPDQFEISRN